MSEMEDRNKAIVHRIYEEMWNRGDLAVAEEIFTHPEGVQKFVKEFRAAFPDLRHRVEEWFVEGDRVAARFSAAGTHTGAWKHYAPTGKPIHYTGVTIAHITAGKISYHQTWWDMQEVIEQISG